MMDASDCGEIAWDGLVMQSEQFDATMCNFPTQNNRIKNIAENNKELQDKIAQFGWWALTLANLFVFCSHL